MLPQNNRLRKKTDFERVFKYGKGFKEGCLSFKLIKNSLKTTRFGFVVGKKVSNKAVARNRVKRRLRDLARSKLESIKEGFDVVIVAHKGAEEASLEEIAAIFSRLIINKFLKK